MQEYFPRSIHQKVARSVLYLRKEFCCAVATSEKERVGPQEIIGVFALCSGSPYASTMTQNLKMDRPRSQSPLHVGIKNVMM